LKAKGKPKATTKLEGKAGAAPHDDLNDDEAPGETADGEDDVSSNDEAESGARVVGTRGPGTDLRRKGSAQVSHCDTNPARCPVI
jgi:hypothetical protein